MRSISFSGMTPSTSGVVKQSFSQFFSPDIIDAQVCLQGWKLNFEGKVAREVYNLGVEIQNVTYTKENVTGEVVIQLANTSKDVLNSSISYARVLYIVTTE